VSIKELKRQYLPVTQYPPQCCASCDHLTDEGLCRQYAAEVPADHLEHPNECDKYTPQVPF